MSKKRKQAADGYMDRKGKTVVPLQFDGTDDFKDGLARVYFDKGEKVGYIDRTGKYVWPPTN
jgi:hypothetical protein